MRHSHHSAAHLRSPVPTAATPPVWAPRKSCATQPSCAGKIPTQATRRKPLPALVIGPHTAVPPKQVPLHSAPCDPQHTIVSGGRTCLAERRAGTDRLCPHSPHPMQKAGQGDARVRLHPSTQTSPSAHTGTARRFRAQLAVRPSAAERPPNTRRTSLDIPAVAHWRGASALQLLALCIAGAAVARSAPICDAAVCARCRRGRRHRARAAALRAIARDA